MPKKIEKEDRVKVTIKLPRALVHAAKVHAMEKSQDLQDLVAGVLANYLKDQAAAKSPSRSALQRMAEGYGVDQRLAVLKKIRDES